MILTQTPYRVSLFGGGTDYPAFFRDGANPHGGAVLGMAIDQYCYVGVKRMPPGQLMMLPTNPWKEVPIKFRVQYSKVDDCTKAEDIKHPAVRAALKYYGLEGEALEFHCFGDQPGRAGLGGSSAFTVGLCHALHRLFRLGMGGQFDAWNVADDAITIEQDVIPETVGCQDQVFAAHGGLNLIRFNRTFRTVHPIDLPAERLEKLAYSLVLVFSGTMRDAHVMAAKQVKEIPNKHAVLVRMREQAERAADLLVSNGDIDEIGHMLDEAWGLKKSITPEITTPHIDLLYGFGKMHGATGGKLLGAGGGGFMLFFVPTERRDSFESALLDAKLRWVPFSVSRHGSRAIITEEE